MNEEIISLKCSMAKMEQKVDDLNEGQLRIEKKLDAFIECADKTYAKKDEVKDLKDNQAWIVKLIVGAVVLAGLGIVLTNK